MLCNRWGIRPAQLSTAVALRGLSDIGSSPVYDFLVAVDCILTTRSRLLCIDEIAIVPEPDAFA
jgi:hypothetical protein